ncbi:MAG: hypothetical protein EHM35_00725 [Planctomycetaceae bacterium]|nr:MAG: hypothetical protein EHM35_00725 [Planctomycetaceae bacterium]
MAKQPWQMVRNDWTDYKASCLCADILAGRGPWEVDKLGYHVDHVRQAYEAGLPVPAEVLADYTNERPHWRPPASKWFVSVAGDLCNTEDINCRPVRRGYAVHHAQINTARELAATLRAGEFAWPGGYRLAFITEDGELLCFKCARENFAQIARAIKDRAGDGWRIVATTNLGEQDPDEQAETCANCYAVLLPAAE